MKTGVYCPLVTPLRADGTIDYDAWGAHIDRLVDAGISGVLAFGSIGEFYAFDTATKAKAAHFVADRVAGRCTTLLGITSMQDGDTAALAREAADAGIDTVVALVPYYNAISEQLVKDYFEDLVEASPLPVVIYNFPDRTGHDIAAQTVAELAGKHPGIIGIKDTVDSAGHTRQIIRAVRERRDDFAVFSGYDEYYFSNRAAGGYGVLSGLTNVFPEIFVAMHAAYEAGDMEQAVAYSRIISEAMSLYDVGDFFISAVKEGAAYAGGIPISSSITGPSIPLTESEKQRTHGLVDQLYSQFSEIRGE